MSSTNADADETETATPPTPEEEPSSEDRSKEIKTGKLIEFRFNPLERTSAKKGSFHTNLQKIGSKNEKKNGTSQDQEDDEKNEKNEKKDQLSLHSRLLPLMQMKHLVVLAGSGTSLGPLYGPSMSDLWTKAEQFITDDVKKIMKQTVGYHITDNNNIEEFLSVLESLINSPLYGNFVGKETETSEPKTGKPTKEQEYNSLTQCDNEIKQMILNCCRLFPDPAKGLWTECMPLLDDGVCKSLGINKSAIVKTADENVDIAFIKQFANAYNENSCTDKEILKKISTVKDKVIDRCILIFGTRTPKWNPDASPLWDAVCKEIDNKAKAKDLKDSDLKDSDLKTHLKDFRSCHQDVSIEQLLNDAREYVRNYSTDSKSKVATVKDWISNVRNTIFENSAELLAGKTDQTEIHQRFLKNLASRSVRSPRPQLFTTNYDRLFEIAAGKNAQSIIDGFSFSFPRIFDPRFFGYDIVRRSEEYEHGFAPQEGVIKLYKLHGSIDWKTDHATDFDRSTTIDENVEAKDACMIFPSSNKYHQSYDEPYLGLMAEFRESLRRPDTCVMVIGFGLNDDHLSGPLLSAIKTNPSLQIIFVLPSAIQLATEEQPATEQDGTPNPKYNRYWDDIRKELEHGPNNITLINGTFGSFTDIMPELKIMSAADRVQHDIAEIARKA